MLEISVLEMCIRDRFYLVRWYVNALAIYGEVSVTYQLASFTTGVSKAHAVSNVVQTTLHLTR